ncbi:MAG: hypothetical protein QXX20_08155 [Candidatus Thermoplasmatota archaeon]
MTNLKTIITIGVISLFLGVSVSPALATFTQPRNQIIYSILDERGNIQNLYLSETEARHVDRFLVTLSEKLQTATSYEELIDILNNAVRDYGRYPLIVFILTLIIKWIKFTNNINDLRPLRKNAFVISWGFTKKFNPFKENKAQLYRPFTLWYYSGKSNLIINSRTTIIDFSPFSIKSLTGRQIGFMKNFAGIYIHRENTLGDNSYTLMLGRAMRVRGFDISPFHR